MSGDFVHPLWPGSAEGTSRSHGRQLDQLTRRKHGPWHNVGDAGEPAFGLTVTQSAGMVQTRFRRLLGGGSEIQIAVDGGADGDEVFTLPSNYFVHGEGNIPLSGHDSAGTYRPFYLDTDTGQIILGTP